MTKHVTIKEVAAAAGISYQTVSKVLNHQVKVSPATEERILKAAAELGYRPNLIARSLRSQRSRMIGFSWEPAPPEQSNQIYTQFMESISYYSEAVGYHILVFPYKPGSAWVNSYRDLIETNRVDGFILSSIEMNDARIPFLLEQKFPFVAFGRANPEWKFPYVDVDGAAGMHKVVEQLVAKGHRRIALLNWSETKSTSVGKNRMKGCMEALNAAGIAVPPSRIALGEGDFAFAYQNALKWLQAPPASRPTAIIAFSDVMAIGVMNAALNLGVRVGPELAVTGFDDSPPMQYMVPGLSSVQQPVWEVGRIAAEMLQGILNDAPPQNQSVLLEPTFIVRESSSFPAYSA
jgi:DNA-binding LacI/PurR family transcriptional regulator